MKEIRVMGRVQELRDRQRRYEEAVKRSEKKHRYLNEIGEHEEGES